jgi:amidase
MVHALDTVYALGRKIARFMEDYDVLLTPTMTAPPIPLGELAPHNPDLDAHIANVFGYAAFTPMANITGSRRCRYPSCRAPTTWP